MPRLPPPPNEDFDITPAESFIRTIDMGAADTDVFEDQSTQSITGGIRAQVRALIRATKRGRDTALSECQSTCKSFYLTWKRGVITGALMTAGVISMVVGARWAWLKWWR